MEAGGDGAELLTRSVRVVAFVVGAKGCKAESALVDQMELLYGVVVDQGLRVFPRSDFRKKEKTQKSFTIVSNRKGICELHQHQIRDLTAVGAVGELELLGQEWRESLLDMSQMEEGTVGNSGQLCWGSDDFGRFIPLKTEKPQICTSA